MKHNVGFKVVTYLFDEEITKTLSMKAINSIKNRGEFNVWEGAVRAGKTVASTIAWLLYIAESPDWANYFLMTGKSQSSLDRNVIEGDFGMRAMLGNNRFKKGRDAKGNSFVDIIVGRGKRKRTKRCYLIGAPNARSFEGLAGLTVHGWYADEINRHDERFVREALNRTIASKYRGNYWTMNPDNPHHWLYTEILDPYLETEDMYLWHFTLDDNKAITEDQKERYRRQYKGIFYKRFILGERCIADGAIFEQFNDTNLYNSHTRPYQLELKADRWIAIDYGTRNDCVFLEILDDGNTVWVDREYRWSSSVMDPEDDRQYSQKSPSQYAEDLKVFMGKNRCPVIIDPSAAYFVEELKNHGFHVVPGDNDVIDGILATSNMITGGKIRVHEENCKALIKEIETYSWDEKSSLMGVDKPIKVHDHGVDALRYYIKTQVDSTRTGLFAGTGINLARERLLNGRTFYSY